MKYNLVALGNRARLRASTLRYACLLSVLLFGIERSASAQHCAGAMPEEPLTSGTGDAKLVNISARLRSEHAMFQTARYVGEYFLLEPMLEVAVKGVSLSAALPYYWLTKNGLNLRGIGDASGRLSWRFFEGELLSGSVYAAASAPSGDERNELGMGHFMFDAGAAGRLSWHRLDFGLQAGYGRALITDGNSHAAHHGLRPLVSPMNLSQLDLHSLAKYQLFDGWRVGFGVYAALPLVLEGTRLAAAYLVTDAQLGPVNIAVEAHAPLLGDAFRHKFVATVGCSF